MKEITFGKDFVIPEGSKNSMEMFKNFCSQNGANKCTVHYYTEEIEKYIGRDVEDTNSKIVWDLK